MLLCRPRSPISEQATLASVAAERASVFGRCEAAAFGGSCVTLRQTKHEHQWNAKLQLTVLLAPSEAVPGLYLHPDHRRRPRRPAVRSEFDV